MTTTQNPPHDPSSELAGEPDTFALESEGWTTARAPRAVEVVQRVFGFGGLVKKHRDLVISSVKRELESRFQGTLLGWLWPLIYPVFMFLVYYFIFTQLLQMKMPDLPEDQKAAMGVYMFVGVLVWASFAESLARGCNVIVENGNLIKKLAFPSEMLPLNIVLVNAVTMMFGVFVFVATCALTTQFAEVGLWQPPGWRLLWIPVLLFVQTLFTFGFTLMLATLQVFLRDTAQIVAIVVTVWMFVTPVFWAPELMNGFEDKIPYLQMNPTYHLIYVWRWVLMSSEPAKVFGYSFTQSLLTLSAWAVGAFAAGYSLFVLTQRRFADEV